MLNNNNLKKPNKPSKIILAYSGGLDTSIIIPWLTENYKGCEIICMTANLGQPEAELEGLEERAKNSGASKLYVKDLREEFVTDFIFPALKMNAKYETYMLGTSLARPIIAKKLVEVARLENADAVCHGSTGKGNDQVRFELTIKAFAPEMQIIAPWRIWEIKSREEAIRYAEKRNIPININRGTDYSKDLNLWHLSHEGLDLENPANEPKYNRDGFLELGNSPEKAPDKPVYVTIGFEKGIPVLLDGKVLNCVELIQALNKIGGENGIGILDLVENRLVGMKSRGVYETPGGTILHRAHEVLETLCLDRDTAHYKALMSQKYGELVYNGQWYTPLREAMDAFADETQKTVTGEVKLKLYKGNIMNAGVTSPYSLYNEELASFGEDSDYNQKDAEGFINLFGLPIKVKAMLKRTPGENNG